MLTLLWSTFPLPTIVYNIRDFIYSSLLLSFAFLLLGAALAVLSFRAVHFDHVLQACAACWFILQYYILNVQSNCGLHMFRISEFLPAHAFQYVILGSFPQRGIKELRLIM